MKKMKIRGKELKRIGFTSDQAISLALRLVSMHYKRSEKMEVLELLEKVNLNPEKYTDDTVLGELALLLAGGPVPKKQGKINWNKAALEFKVYGTEHIDPAALEQMQMAMKLPITVKGAPMLMSDMDCQ